MRQAKIALITDWITKTGGGEKVVEQLHLLYPEAPIYTSYCSDIWRTRLDDCVITGYLQHWPFSKLRRFLPLLRQWWFKGLDLSQYDIVISITGNGEAKFVRKSDQQTHICYCHTPVHFYWAQYNEYLAHPSMKPYWLVRLGMKLFVKPLRKRDFEAAQRVDYFIANSTAIQADIATYYDKASAVIYPPIDTEQFVQLLPRDKKRIIPEKPQCIWWGRVVPAKRLDIVIAACNQLAWPLTIIGDGPELPRLKQLAGPTVTFTEFIDDTARNEYIQNADLFLFPSKEDFGVAPVEALAAGLPVVAYKAGGALDYIAPLSNGLYFDKQSAASLATTLRQHKSQEFNILDVSASAQRYSVKLFRKTVQEFVNQHATITVK